MVESLVMTLDKEEHAFWEPMHKIIEGGMALSVHLDIDLKTFGTPTVAIVREMQAFKINFEAVQTNAETTDKFTGQTSPNLKALLASKTLESITERLDIIEDGMKHDMPMIVAKPDQKEHNQWVGKLNAIQDSYCFSKIRPAAAVILGILLTEGNFVQGRWVNSLMRWCSPRTMQTPL